MRRSRMSYKRSKKSFKRGARRVNKKNRPRLNMRGGIRI